MARFVALLIKALKKKRQKKPHQRLFEQTVTK